MSEESVGLVRRAYETWNEQGPAAHPARCWPTDVELHDAPEIPTRRSLAGAATP